MSWSISLADCAFRANSRAAMSFLWRSQMHRACLEGFQQTLWHLAGPDRRNDLLNLIIGKQHRCVLLDIAGVAGQQHVLRHRRLEFTFPPEHHERYELALVDTEEGLQGLHMAVILMQRILEAEFLPIQPLRPLRAFGITEYPAIP